MIIFHGFYHICIKNIELRNYKFKSFTKVSNTFILSNTLFKCTIRVTELEFFTTFRVTGALD